jgi:CxxC-x17-CxxC domain-containing protein
MNNYNNNRSGGSRGGQRSDRRGSGRSNFGSRDNRQSEMHDATCADCGNNCRIPFFPRSGKPVYCSNCFEQRGNGGQDSRRRNDYGDRRPSFSDKRDFKPRNDRPQVNYKEQFEIVNTKLDKILKMLSSSDDVKVVKKEASKTKAKTNKVSEETPVTPKETKKKKVAKVKTVAEIIAQAEPEAPVTPKETKTKKVSKVKTVAELITQAEAETK